MKKLGVSLLLIVILIVTAGCGGNKKVVRDKTTTGETITDPSGNPTGGPITVPKDEPEDGLVPKIIFEDDFEVSSGWSPAGMWHRQKNNSSIVNTAVPKYVMLPVGDTSGGKIPTAYSGSYCFWYGKTATGNYIGTQSVEDSEGSGGTSIESTYGSLTSPTISIPKNANPVLTFMTWYEIESVNSKKGKFDQMYVRISGDGGNTYKEIYRLNPDENPSGAKNSLAYTSGGFNVPGKWIEVKLDLSEYRGKTIRLKFTFNNPDRSNNGFRGWFIDLVRIINAE